MHERSEARTATRGNSERVLFFQTSGATQHVFSRCLDPDTWLYKTPAFDPRVLPAPLSIDALRPTAPAKRLFFATTIEPAANRLSSLRVMVWRWSTFRAFRRMLSVLGRAERTGVSWVVLPYRVLHDTEVILRFPTYEYLYRGPMLAQRRADFFFEYFRDLRRFQWRELVAAQHQLWRAGIALGDASSVTGPMNWALQDGKMYLGDTGSMTTEYSHARAVLSGAAMDSWERELLAWQGSPKEPGEEYIAFVRREVNAVELARHWRWRGS